MEHSKGDEIMKKKYAFSMTINMYMYMYIYIRIDILAKGSFIYVHAF